MSGRWRGACPGQLDPKLVGSAASFSGACHLGFGPYREHHVSNAV
jgi:hypothetical protein